MPALHQTLCLEQGVWVLPLRGILAVPFGVFTVEVRMEAKAHGAGG